MRKLASIQRITKLTTIENADKIEVASIEGWKVVVPKDEFKEQDLVVYVEIDSVLPDKPEFDFLRQRKFRVRTIKLRGQISQGIAFSTAILPEGTIISEGMDVTDILGIEQYIYQIPAQLQGMIKGDFPSFIQKTDETRVQVIQDVLKRHKGTKCFITEKVDGSSCTLFLRDGEFGVCSRNLELKESPENTIWKLARELNIEGKMRLMGKNIALQGEIIGNGIQKNPLRLENNKILFFNAFDIDKYRYLDYAEFKILIDSLGLEIVPIIDTNYSLIDDIDELVKLSIDKSRLNPKTHREGIVIRPLIEKFDMQLSQGFGNGRVSFKVVNPEYLLKYDA